MERFLYSFYYSSTVIQMDTLTFFCCTEASELAGSWKSQVPKTIDLSSS